MQNDSTGPHTPQSKLQLGDQSITDRLSRAWDASYRKGRYSAEPALGFTADIIKELKTCPNLMNGRGLYVGCGNGRNYAKLVESGLNIVGLDVSGVALAELSKKLPQCSSLLHRGNFLDYRQDAPFQDPFQYVIAIQVFQHASLAVHYAYYAFSLANVYSYVSHPFSHLLADCF